jgi:hypothetical protein
MGKSTKIWDYWVHHLATANNSMKTIVKDEGIDVVNRWTNILSGKSVHSTPLSLISDTQAGERHAESVRDIELESVDYPNGISLWVLPLEARDVLKTRLGSGSSTSSIIATLDLSGHMDSASLKHISKYSLIGKILFSNYTGSLFGQWNLLAPSKACLIECNYTYFEQLNGSSELNSSNAHQPTPFKTFLQIPYIFIVKRLDDKRKFMSQDIDN